MNSSCNLRKSLVYSIKSVPMAVGVHPFPFRTRQLSPLALKILGWKRPGKISRCRHKKASDSIESEAFLCFMQRA